jgi:hypothetical protein
LPERLTPSFTPFQYAHRSNDREMNSGPLSIRSISGAPRVLVHRELEFLPVGVSELSRTSCRRCRGFVPRRFCALMLILERVGKNREGRDGMPSPGSSLSPWSGAPVAPQQSRILRPGR